MSRDYALALFARIRLLKPLSLADWWLWLHGEPYVRLADIEDLLIGLSTEPEAERRPKPHDGARLGR